MKFKENKKYEKVEKKLQAEGNKSYTNQFMPVGTQRFSLAVTTTVYLSVEASFSGDTLSAYAFIRARRVR